MTPVEIEVLLHYHCRCEEHPNIKAPAFQRAATRLVARSILEIEPHPEDNTAPGTTPPSWRTAERGKALVEALCRVPFPEKKWIYSGEWAVLNGE